MATVTKHIKLRLIKGYDDDVAAIIKSIPPGRLAATIIQLLRLYPQLSALSWQFNQGTTSAPAADAQLPITPAAAPVSELPTTTARPAKAMIKVALSAGFDALND